MPLISLNSSTHKASVPLLLAALWLLTVPSALATDIKAPANAAKTNAAPVAAEVPLVKTPDSEPSVVFGGQSLQVDTAKKKIPQVKSFFFNAQEMASIRKAVAVYVRIASGDTTGDAMDFLRRLQGGGADDKAKPGARYFVYPQYFLASLFYDSPEEWSVRINSEKLTTKTPESMGVRVVDIDKDKVKIEWIPTDFTKVEEVWNVSSNKDARVEVQGRKVIFTLRPNQTFSSYAMRVVEGKVMPMVLDLAPKNAKGEKADALPGEAKPAAKPGEKDFLDEILGARKPK